MAVLKVDVTPKVFGDLDNLLKLEDNPFRVIRRMPGKEEERVNCVRIMPGNRRFDGSYIQVALEVTEEVENFQGHLADFHTVDRSILEKLCDILEIFPRDGSVVAVGSGDLREIYSAILQIGHEFIEMTRTLSTEDRGAISSNIVRKVSALNAVADKLDELIGAKA